MQGLIPAIYLWCNYSLCRDKSGSLITGALSIAGERICSFHCFLDKFFHRVKTTFLSHSDSLVLPLVSEQLLSLPQLAVPVSALDTFHMDSKSNDIILGGKNSARITGFRAVAGNCWRRKNHNTPTQFLVLDPQFWMILHHNHYCPLLQEILSLGCEHSDTGTVSCTASAQPSFAPGYQHNIITGTSYQCRNAGINKVNQLCIKSSWRIINPIGSYSYEKSTLYTV